jgi:hypothetical protein
MPAVTDCRLRVPPLRDALSYTILIFTRMVKASLYESPFLRPFPCQLADVFVCKAHRAVLLRQSWAAHCRFLL